MTPLFSIESRYYCLLVDIHFAKYSPVDEALADLPTADNNLRSFQIHDIDTSLGALYICRSFGTENGV
jgi:hypothetical protein